MPGVTDANTLLLIAQPCYSPGMTKKPFLLTINEVAEMINKSPQTLRRWDDEGYFPAVRVGKRRDRMYRPKDLMDFLKGKDFQKTKKK